MARLLQIFAAQQLWRKQVADAFSTLPAARLTGSKTYDPPLLAPAASSTPTTVTVTGAALGMQAAGAFSLDLQGLVLNAWISATDTVSVSLFNPTAGALDLASGTLTGFAWTA